MTDALKPCPFCGSPARLAGGPMAQETYSVWCSGQARHSMDYGFDREVAVAAWNARADLATPLDDPRVRTLQDKAQAVVDRWDSPLWKDLPHTGESIDELRAALSALGENK